jgi:hypothetical protein
MDWDRQIFLPPGLVLGESPVHGLGVFATTAFKKNHCFGEFVGQEMTAKEFRGKYGGDFQYCYRMGRANKVIVAKENRNFITYINDGLHGQLVQKVNVVLKKRCLYALHDIEVGDELFLDYGFHYVW